MTDNTKCTRYYSERHEKSIAKALGGETTTNSGASKFTAGDVIIKDASLLVEAKCCMNPKKSVSVKKDWITKNKKESFSVQLDNQAVCINFEPDGDNYYVISEKLMKFLVEKLKEFNE